MVKWLTQLFAKQPCTGSSPVRASREVQIMKEGQPVPFKEKFGSLLKAGGIVGGIIGLIKRSELLLAGSILALFGGAKLSSKKQHAT